VPDGLPFVDVEPPVFAIVAWGNDSIELALEAWKPKPGSVVVLTNAVVDSTADVAIADARTLSRVVETDAALRLRMPSLLGVCGDELFAPEGSTADIAAARELARVFVPTRAYRAAVDAVSRHGFAVLTGPPEMGKTASARMLGLAKLTAGWEFHECIRPDQLWAAYRRDRAQVFVADDAFGSTEYRPDAAEHWAVELDRILRAMDDRHWLVWTSRPAPLKAGLRRIHREHGVERFPQPAEVQVDAAALDVAEKALILFRHARAAGLPSDARDGIRLHGWEIVSHEHFTPERIRRFVDLHAVRTTTSPQELALIVDSSIREPTAAMSASFHALEPAHRAVLVALLDSPAGAVHVRDLTIAVRCHGGAAMTQRPEVLLDRLTDHFIRIGEGGAVTWVHPSWRDLVIDELAADGDARRRFLAVSSIDGLLLALSTGGGATGERRLPLLSEDADWDALADRIAALAPELDEPATKRLLVALAEALGTGRNAELDAFASDTLALLARRWDRARATLPVGLLADWFALRVHVRERPPAPDVAATWFEYRPVEGAVDPNSPVDLADLDEWSALVELLFEHEPELLETFGVPQAALESFADEVERAPVLDDPATVTRILLRVGNAYRPLADRLFRATFALRPKREPEETYAPRELSPELTELLETSAHVADRRPALVWRVLRDL
jgi:hypothetical protein